MVSVTKIPKAIAIKTQIRSQRALRGERRLHTVRVADIPYDRRTYTVARGRYTIRHAYIYNTILVL